MTTIALCIIATVSYKKTKQKYHTPLCIACLDIDAVAQKQYLITYALLSDNHRTDIQYWLLSCTLIRSIFETNVLKLLCDSLTSLCLTGHTHTALFILICDFFLHISDQNLGERSYHYIKKQLIQGIQKTEKLTLKEPTCYIRKYH